MNRTNEFSKKDIEENKGIAWLAYVGILFIVPMYGGADSPYASFHARQGMLLFIDEIIVLLLVLVANVLAGCGILPEVMRPLRSILYVVFLLSTIFYVCFGIINTVKGKAKELPIIGRMGK